MGENSAIKWTDHTFNPWWGCARVSPGCQHCYAETFAKRTGHDVWGANAERRMLSEANWRKPYQWNAAAVAAGAPALVFCASMADVFEDRPELNEPRARLLRMIEETPALRWQLLTKRPENVRRMVPVRWLLRDAMAEGVPYGWPANCWIGTTVEDQQRADERLPALLDIPAPVRFLSCEPLLGPLDLSPWFERNYGRAEVGWVIVGGESGPGHRPLQAEHAADVCAQAFAAEIPLFFKQWGGRTPDAGGDSIDVYRTGKPEQYRQWPAQAGVR